MEEHPLNHEIALTDLRGEELAQALARKAAIETAMKAAVHEAVLKHQRLGLPMVVWQNEQVVWIPAEQLADYVAGRTR